jgi:hypothetical protein
MGARNRFFEVPFYASIFSGFLFWPNACQGSPKGFSVGVVNFRGASVLWNLLPEGNWILKQWLVNAGFLGRLLGIFQG